jgi:hypothetical protein
MKNKIIIFPIVLSILSGCSSNETDGTLEIDSTKTELVDTLSNPEMVEVPAEVKSNKLVYTSADETNLLLFEKFPLGINFELLKTKLPTINPLHAEDNNEQLAAKGLQESIQDITFLNYKGKLEFNFKNDVLIRYSIVFNEPNEKKGSKLYSQLLEYYNNHLGASQPVNTEEDNYYAQINSWYLNPDYVLAAYNLNSGNITIAAQSYKPGQQQ